LKNTTSYHSLCYQTFLFLFHFNHRQAVQFYAEFSVAESQLVLKIENRKRKASDADTISVTILNTMEKEGNFLR